MRIKRLWAILLVPFVMSWIGAYEAQAQTPAQPPQSESERVDSSAINLEPLGEIPPPASTSTPRCPCGQFPRGQSHPATAGLSEPRR